MASVCGFYCVPTLPLYTAAKQYVPIETPCRAALTLANSGVVGFVRSYGKYLPEEKITLNAVCPNVIRTNISTPAFYDSLEEKGLLTPMEPLLEAFESLLGTSETSGECFEIGKNPLQCNNRFRSLNGNRSKGWLYNQSTAGGSR